MDIYWTMSFMTGCFHSAMNAHVPYTGISIFDKLIWHTIAPKNFLFGTAQFSLWANGTVNYDYIVTNSIKSLLIGSRCIPNGIHINYFLNI